jgi:hypothetical protein
VIAVRNIILDISDDSRDFALAIERIKFLLNYITTPTFNLVRHFSLLDRDDD